MVWQSATSSRHRRCISSLRGSCAKLKRLRPALTPLSTAPAKRKAAQARRDSQAARAIWQSSLTRWQTWAQRSSSGWRAAKRQICRSRSQVTAASSQILWLALCSSSAPAGTPPAPAPVLKARSPPPSLVELVPFGFLDSWILGSLGVVLGLRECIGVFGAARLIAAHRSASAGQAERTLDQKPPANGEAELSLSGSLSRSPFPPRSCSAECLPNHPPPHLGHLGHLSHLSCTTACKLGGGLPRQSAQPCSGMLSRGERLR